MQRSKAATPLLSAPSVIAATIPSPAPSLAMTVAGIDAGEVRRSNRRRRSNRQRTCITEKIGFARCILITLTSTILAIGGLSQGTVCMRCRLYFSMGV